MLFNGTDRAAKMTAAEAIANELACDLYRVDLRQVMSNYIGEREKNIDRVLNAAESVGGVLLFDEADALFGNGRMCTTATIAMRISRSITCCSGSNRSGGS